MKIGMFPFNSNDNKYIELIKEAVLNIDDSVELIEFNPSIKNKSKYNYNYVILNWYESLNRESFIGNFGIFLVRVLKFLILKAKKTKIIWIIHNRVPHDAKYIYFPRTLMKILAKYSHFIIIHSHETKRVLDELLSLDKIKNKIVYIPHPNYIGAYGQENTRANEVGNKIKLLFIGQIKPYKNVDLLIEAFNELNLTNATLTLAGKVSSKEYQAEILKLIAGNKSVYTKFGFIEDKEIPNLLSKHDILVLPYDIKSSLNSGTIILAFSNKKTVISPLIGTLKDFSNRSNFYSYQYSTKEEHKEALKKMINQVAADFSSNPYILEEKGQECYNVVKENNSNEVITSILKNFVIE